MKTWKDVIGIREVGEPCLNDTGDTIDVVFIASTSKGGCNAKIKNSDGSVVEVSRIYESIYSNQTMSFTVPDGAEYTITGALNPAVWSELTDGPPPSGELKTVLPTDGFPYEVRLGDGKAWISCGHETSIQSYDLTTGVRKTYPLGEWGNGSTVAGLAYGAGVVMVADSVGDSVWILTPSTGEITEVSLGSGSYPRDCIYDGINFWVTLSNSGGIIKVSPDGIIGTFISTGPNCFRGSYDGQGSLWISNFDNNTVSGIDVATEAVVATIGVGSNPWQTRFIQRDGYVWVSNWGSGSISIIDPLTNTVVGSISLSSSVGGPHDIVEIGDKAYVSLSSINRIDKIDIDSKSVIEYFTTYDDPACLVFDGDYMWNTNAKSNVITRTLI